MALLTAQSLTGARSPRVEVRPSSAVGSHGDVAIELAASAGLILDPWQCDGLDAMLSVRADGKWACFEYAELVSRQQGKTAGLLAPRALAGLLVFGEDKILWSAHRYDTSMESYKFLWQLFLGLGDQVDENLVDVGDVRIRRHPSHGKEAFERLDTGAMIKMQARSKGTARGFSADVQIVDEAFAYTSEQQDAQGPTATARPNAQIIYASSPPLDRWTGEPLFKLRARALEGDDSLGYRDWGIDLDLEKLGRMGPSERQAVLNDLKNWAAANPALGLGRVTEETIRRNRRSMTEEGFARECLGCWPVQAGEGGQIPAASWKACCDPEPENAPTRAEVIGVDAALDRSFAVLALAGRRELDDLPHLEVIDQRAGMAWVVQRCVELRDRHECSFIVDPIGPAGSLIPDMEAAGLEVDQPDGREWVGACASLYDAIVEDRMRHLGQAQLNDAVKVARRRDVGDGVWAWARRKSGGDIAALAAATGALWGLEQRGGVEPWVDWG